MNTGELIVRTESIYLIKLDIILYYSIQATPAAPLINVHNSTVAAAGASSKGNHKKRDTWLT